MTDFWFPPRLWESQKLCTELHIVTSSVMTSRSLVEVSTYNTQEHNCLHIQVVYSSKMLTPIYEAALSHNSENHSMNPLLENLKSNYLCRPCIHSFQAIFIAYLWHHLEFRFVLGCSEVPFRASCFERSTVKNKVRIFTKEQNTCSENSIE
jgi:hypothetical protein